MQTIKIFLGSSITELHDERMLLGDYLLNSVRPIFKRDGVDIEVVKCEDIRTGYRGKSSQEEINDLLRGCDISVFMFKTKAGPVTVREYNVAQELVGTKNHEIYVYCFGVTEEEKEESLKSFKQQMRDIELYWKTCKDINDLEKQLIIGLLDFERQLLGLTKPSAVEQENETEQNGDARYAKYQQNEQAQTQLREEIHKDIEDLLQQTKTVMANEDETIAARIFKVIELYKKADLWASKTDYDKEKYSELLFNYASFLNKYGLYHDAVTIYLRQIVLAEELYGEGHIYIASSYNNISGVFWKLSDYEKTLEYLFKVKTIYEKELGAETPKIASTYNNIGLVYKNKGDYNTSLKYHLMALTIREKEFGIHNAETAQSYMNISSVYYDKGNYNEALKYYQMTISIFEKCFGMKHYYTATSYDGIGLVYLNQGDYDKAYEFLLEALNIREKDFGPDGPETAISYNSIGMLYNELGDYDKAMRYLFMALEIRERFLSTNHPSIATSYNEIGLVYQNQGNSNMALEYLNKALTIRMKVLGTEHPYTATSYNNIGTVYRAQGNFDKALKFHQKALEIIEKVFGTEHPDNATSYNNIGWVYREKEDFKTALDYYIKTYQIRKKKLGDDHSKTKNVLKSINDVKEAMNSSKNK